MLNVNTKGNNAAQEAAEKAAARRALWAVRGKKLVRVIGSMRFWHVAGLCFLFRVLVTNPIGALLALITGTIWGVSNLGMLKQKATALQCNMAAWTSEGTVSLWYNNEGRQQILELIEKLSTSGSFQCNLSQQVTMPPKAQWSTIRNELLKEGIVSQVAGDSFYIQWYNPNRQADACQPN